ncbi:olfactory receptor 52E4-like [Gopherus evgoodei]|uniref:olfactory receptor 52E4-like n=1 Tax=Gopherus evgoodei TaxID=1825980 RepID=UPI0011CF2882|nr:olfactory receptor 52E4-like [Gopherus evgoodei]
MSDSNTTDFTNPSTFILLGIPGLEAAHVWISIPFCTMYTIAMLGNFTILFIVKREPSLHVPMYYFLCMLVITDLVLSTSILPKTLTIFWFNSREIDFGACLTQIAPLSFLVVRDQCEISLGGDVSRDPFQSRSLGLLTATQGRSPMVGMCLSELRPCLQGFRDSHGYQLTAISLRSVDRAETTIGTSFTEDQMYFLHCFLVTESGIFMAMAFDRYMAICDPLRHSIILTNSMVAKIGLAVVLRSSILMLPYILVARQWPYCRTNIIPHFYCQHMAVVKLACAEIHVSNYYSLSVVFCVFALDPFVIAVSYTQILRAIFSLPTKDARLKTFGTCGSHLCAILAFYIPCLFSVLTHQFGKNMVSHFHILIASIYLLMPPMLNPIIYGVRTKQIRDRLLRLFSHKGTNI